MCVAMEIYAEESHLDLASRAGSGHLQAGAGRQGALGLPPPVTAPVICKEDNDDDKRHYATVLSFSMSNDGVSDL